MKLVQLIRYGFQIMVFVSVLCVVGSVGAWETGSIHFAQLLLQLFLFAFCGIFAARLSHRRFFIRLRPRRRRPAAAPVRQRRVAAVH